MKKSSISLLFILLFAAACGGSNGGPASDAAIGNNADPQQQQNQPLETGSFKALLFTRTVGFRHASIERGVMVLQTLGMENDFVVDHTEDQTLFTPENLAQYRIVIFMNTTLDVLETDAQQNALEQFIRAGGGFVGIHSAADTEHDWPFYGELVGAYFLSHPVQQTATFDIEQPEHITVSHLPNPWTTFDELYSFEQTPRGEVNVLMAVRESSYTQNPNTSCLPDSPSFPNGVSGTMGDHPMAWCHDKFAGRAWYTALGHEVAQYETTEFRRHVLNGILLAARRVGGSCSTTDADTPDREIETVACQNTAM